MPQPHQTKTNKNFKNHKVISEDDQTDNMSSFSKLLWSHHNPRLPKRNHVFTNHKWALVKMNSSGDGAKKSQRHC